VLDIAPRSGIIFMRTRLFPYRAVRKQKVKHMKNLIVGSLRLATSRLAAFVVMAFVFCAMATGAFAQTDITGVIDSLDGYLSAAIAVGVAVLLFTLGRAIVRKVAR